MYPGFRRVPGPQKPCLHISESDTMTKRETQAREYAAESYEKTPLKRGVSHMGWAITDAERLALEFAVGTGRVATHDAATLRNLLERLK